MESESRAVGQLYICRSALAWRPATTTVALSPAARATASSSLLRLLRRRNHLSHSYRHTVLNSRPSCLRHIFRNILNNTFRSSALHPTFEYNLFGALQSPIHAMTPSVRLRENLVVRWYGDRLQGMYGSRGVDMSGLWIYCWPLGHAV